MKFYGRIGFVKLVEKDPETSPGEWSEDVIEKYYRGDVVKNTRSFQAAENVNDNINISNEISIVADPYATINSHLIRYVEFMGALWKVTNVTVEPPRLKLTIGGVYNGKQD